MQKVALIILIFLFSLSSFAKDLGVMGTVYPIAEKDLLVEIENRVLEMQQNGEWEKLQAQINQVLQQKMDRPEPVENLIRTRQENTRFFDPSIVSPTDIRNAQGDVIIKAGTRLNPLDKISLNQTLIFYNADDPDQTAWAKQIQTKIKGKIKWILVGGSVVDQMKLFNQPIYFDQGGKLIKRFGIQQVPAIVTQEKNQLKIEEVKP